MTFVHRFYLADGSGMWTDTGLGFAEAVDQLADLLRRWESSPDGELTVLTSGGTWTARHSDIVRIEIEVCRTDTPSEESS